jgi:hypothetical protein
LADGVEAGVDLHFTVALRARRWRPAPDRWRSPPTLFGWISRITSTGTLPRAAVDLRPDLFRVCLRDNRQSSNADIRSVNFLGFPRVAVPTV